MHCSGRSRTVHCSCRSRTARCQRLPPWLAARSSQLAARSCSPPLAPAARPPRVRRPQSRPSASPLAAVAALPLQRQGSLQNIADVYFNVGINIRNILHSLRSCAAAVLRPTCVEAVRRRHETKPRGRKQLRRACSRACCFAGGTCIGGGRACMFWPPTCSGRSARRLWWSRLVHGRSRGRWGPQRRRWERDVAACKTVFGLRVPFWGGAPAIELSYKLS